MGDIERIYLLLSHSNGLKIRVISNELELDKCYVAELLFSPQNIPYWYQDDNSLWFAKEGSLQIEENTEEKEDLLTPIEAPQKFNINRFFEEEQCESLRFYLNQISKYRNYSNAETIELFKRYRNGDSKAFDMIIKSRQRLVANIALLYSGKGVPLEDIIQEGNIGLIKAAECFDHTQYCNFSYYAKNLILQSISNSMISIPFMIKLPLNQLNLYRKICTFKEKYEQIHEFSPSANDIELDENVNTEIVKYLNDLPDDLFDIIHVVNDLDCFEGDFMSIDDFQNMDYNVYYINRLLSHLDKRERLILRAYYGINEESKSLSTIAEHFYLTRERIRQIVEKSIQQMKDLAGIKSEKIIVDDFI